MTAAQERPGLRVGNRYRLETLIGRGGTAEVWSALDEALGRRVALKLVTSSGGDHMVRVAEEARLLASLNHPGLVPVYDAGTDESGRPWVVMELVTGETLADAIARGALEPYRTAQIGRVLAEALAYVHGEGLVHRDIKPANVLLGTDGRVRLTDFGIARLVDAAHVTATGMTVGTASYLSPEQVTGSDVGPLSDVYSFGLVLLECLTGQREYPGTAVEVALARLHRQPVIPPELPSGWPGLLAAMTARSPSLRPTAGEAGVELARIAAGGQATMAVPVAGGTAALLDPADRTQVLDRTEIMAQAPRVPPRIAPVPASRAAGVPTSRPARPVLPSRRRRPSGAWVGVLLLAVVLGIGGFLLAQQRANDPGPNPPAVSPTLPATLQKDLTQLQQDVG